MQNAITPRILLTVPALNDQGGVAGFFNSILPHLMRGTTTLEIGGTHGKGNLFYPLTDQFRFRQAVRRRQPALIHLNPSLDLKCLIRDGLFAWQAKQMGLPVLVFWHGWNKQFEKEVETRLMWFFLKTFGRADGFIVLASEFERKLRAWGINAPIYRGTTTVDEKLLEGFDLAKKIKKQEVRKEVKILFLARLERAKGVFETVDAIRILQKKNLPISLSIAGDGPIRKELTEYVGKLNLPKGTIRFLGYVKNNVKIKAFIDHDLYCFPTFYGEGLPISVLEAMAFGMPVVTSPVGGLADVFENMKMGTLLQSINPEIIAISLEALIKDRDGMVEIGRYNAAYAKKQFMASVVAKQLAEIYESMTS